MPPFNPKAPSRTLTLSIAAADDDDYDDDDFQNPIKTPSYSLNLLSSSSTKNPNSPKPLHPHNGPRPRKKPRPSTFSSGKENRQVAPTKVNGAKRRRLWGPGVGLTSGPEKTLEVAPGTGGNGIGDGKVEPLDSKRPQVCTQPGKDGSFDRKGPVAEGRTTLSNEGLSGSRESPQLEERGGLLGNGVPLLPQSRTVDVKPYVGSIESRLLRSGVAGSSWSEDKEGVENEGDEDGDFDAGTQLRKLMELCSEVNDKGNFGLDSVDDAGDDEDGEHLVGGEEVSTGVVECPLCGTDITGMSEEMRNVHTNACLDDGSSLKVTICADEKNSSHQGTDSIQVREFLSSLELSKYEEAFVREEIDWETLQWLTEEDLMSIGVTALGPRKKIVHALNNLRRGSSNAHELKSNSPRSMTEERTKVSLGNKLITEYFQGHSINRGVHSASKPSSVTACNKGPVQKRVTARKPVSNTKSKDIPPWCSIPGTNFQVDAFRFLRGGCSHWFLTHFHLDHYQGLTKNFRHGKIYCSSITANLVNMKIGIPWERLHVLPLGEKVDMGGVNVTCLDANHCPGSIIILFEPPNGKAVLHTGDFRFCEAMAGCSLLQSCNIHTLILDTTYCNPQYDFPKQEAVIQFVIEAIQAEAFNPKTLFLIGSYTVGKERLFLEVARYLRKKVYVGAAKLHLLQCLGLSKEDMLWFTSNEMESDIHVVPMWTIASFKRMKHVSNQYSGRYDLIVAFSPTGWTFGKGKKKSPGRRWQQGTIIRYEVPYSEHSSFSELQEFLQLISPEVIIPSVNNTGSESVDSMIALLASDTQPGSTL